jgi:pimeloyl-ACP methyl ester carboxylesterase
MRTVGRRSLLTAIAKVTIIAVVVYVVASAVMAYVIWHPYRKAVHTDPGKYGLSYETVSFPSADGITLRGWYVDTPGEKTVMVLHGSGSVKDNYINMEMSRVLANAGYDILLFDFRGHGESDGSIFSLGKWETRDIAGALAYLESRGVREVGVLAYSMGAASALLAAPDHPQMRVIVADSSFARLSTVMQSEGSKAIFFMPLMYPGVTLMSKVMFGIDPDETQPMKAVAQMKDRPLFLIHSTGDSLIPVSEIYELEKAGSGNHNLEVWVAQGHAHVSTFADHKEEYGRRVVRFFDRHFKSRITTP